MKWVSVGWRLVKLFESWTEGKLAANRWLVVVLPSLLVVVWNLPYLWTGGLIAELPGDSDYFFQAHEAIRKTIVEYHQFPWINIWVGGGVPLFANPQVGVISPQTVLTILLGTVQGLKLSIIFYSLVGYFGAFLLFRKWFKASIMAAMLLGLCWVFNGFYVAHLFDHYSFIFFIVFPLGLYLQLNILRGKVWAYYGLYLAILALSAVHYAFLQIILISLLVGVYQLVSVLRGRRGLKSLVVRFLGAGVIFLVLAGARLAYSMQYIFQFPKSYLEPANSFGLLLRGLFTPGPHANLMEGRFLTGNNYGAGEYAAYMGIAIACALFVIAASLLIDIARKKKPYYAQKRLALAGLFLIFCLTILTAKGEFSSVAPFSLIHLLPGYSNMRIPSRMLLWTGFVALCIIAYYLGRMRNSARSAVVLLLIVGTFELFLLGLFYPRNQFTREPVVFRSGTAEFVEYQEYYPGIDTVDELYYPNSIPIRVTEPYYAYEATKNNIGELYGYEPVYPTQDNLQGRCGINYGCQLVQSNNARIAEWSPNKIRLYRTGSGPIVLNIAPSGYWVVNGVRLHPVSRVAEPGQLTITDPSNNIDIIAQPKTFVDMARRGR